MTAALFMDAVRALKNLTEPMVQALERIAGRLTDEQRTTAIQDFQRRDSEISMTLDKYERTIKEADDETRKLGKEMIVAEEDDEKATDIAAADSKFN